MKYHAPNAEHVQDVLVNKRELYRTIERMAGMQVPQVRSDCMGDDYVLPDPKPADIYTHVLRAIADFKAKIPIRREDGSMAAIILGKLGGASKSTAKQRASRKNGRKGGNPKKTVDKQAR